jgi:hypothetical protein
MTGSTEANLGFDIIDMEQPKSIPSKEPDGGILKSLRGRRLTACRVFA